MADGRSGEGLSGDEFAQMIDLLRRYCAHDLDQFQARRTDTPYGPVYIFMGRSLPQGWEPSMFWEF
ncbi:hypothetical protein [Streptomyces sp. NPDC094032]|uniref:hypothetical protein n=1 Tax=Streptomyces sp. NPDC094032 TaxID=3155308 RepID=UPI00331840A8